MFFEDWKEHKDEVINKGILWEYDTSSPSWSWDKMKKTVVQRVVEYGRVEDWYAMLQLYGGYENIRKILLEVNHLTPKSIALVTVLFDIKKEEMQCYKNQQLRKQFMNY
ncbi:MAG: DUF6922 domain-containing protein [Sphaerochaetaceae bacterium]|jgi:hypothetical protein